MVAVWKWNVIKNPTQAPWINVPVPCCAVHVSQHFQYEISSVVLNDRWIWICQFFTTEVVLNKLQSYLSNNSIYEKFQSGFKSCHTMESARLRILNDIMLITNSGQFMGLVLLDLSFLLIWSTMKFLYLVLKHVLVYGTQYYSGLGHILLIGGMLSILGIIPPLRYT